MNALLLAMAAGLTGSATPEDRAAPHQLPLCPPLAGGLRTAELRRTDRFISRDLLYRKGEPMCIAPVQLPGTNRREPDAHLQGEREWIAIALEEINARGRKGLPAGR